MKIAIAGLVAAVSLTGCIAVPVAEPVPAPGVYYYAPPPPTVYFGFQGGHHHHRHYRGHRHHYRR
jgi:hypothetical protein